MRRHLAQRVAYRASASSAALAGADAGIEPCRLVGDPIRHLVAALLGTMLTIFRRIGGLGVGKPSRDLGGKLLFGFPHAPIGHRLVHAGIGLMPGRTEHAIERLEVLLQASASSRSISLTPMMALSGVRSSWLILARNCDLCWLASASWRLLS